MEKKATTAQVSPPVAGQKRKQPTFLSMDQTQVELLIGEDKKSFLVHKDLLCYHSEVFRGAFEGSFRESEEKFMRLIDVDEPIFRLFQHWLYAQAMRDEESPVTKGPRFDRSNCIHYRKHIEMCGECNSHYRTKTSQKARGTSTMTPAWLESGEFLFKTDRPYYECFTDLYVFADKYDVPQLRRDLMTLLLGLDNYNEHNGGTLCSTFDVHAMHEALPSSSPLLVYTIKRMAECMHARPIDKQNLASSVPKKVLIELFVTIASKPKDILLQKSLWDDLKDGCQFHEHKSEKDSAECREAQARDTQFYVGFLQAIMANVPESEED